MGTDDNADFNALPGWDSGKMHVYGWISITAAGVICVPIAFESSLKSIETMSSYRDIRGALAAQAIEEQLQVLADPCLNEFLCSTGRLIGDGGSLAGHVAIAGSVCTVIGGLAAQPEIVVPCGTVAYHASIAAVGLDVLSRQCPARIFTDLASVGVAKVLGAFARANERFGLGWQTYFNGQTLVVYGGASLTATC
jgi:hypothetical protein